MQISEVIQLIESEIPIAYAEDFDNVGLLVGNKNENLKGILVTLDTTEDVVDEAIAKGCNFICSFHPIIFKGLKSLTGKTYVERTVLKAIQHNIAIYAIHTALDNSVIGVNKMICNQLNLKNTSILIPQKNTLKKLTTYVPQDEAEALRTALFNAGAGHIENYSNCSFNIPGEGTYMGNDLSNPVKGEKNKVHTEPETQISVLFPKHLETQIIQALHKNHSYETVAYEVITIENKNQTIGIGMVGDLDIALPENAFLEYLKSHMQTSSIRHSKLLNKSVKRIAVLGGSGAFGISAAKRANADAYITADLKYHDFFTADNDILLADIGHYESEQFTKNGLVAILTKKIHNFAIILSETNTNPVKYF
jgi:dinuclear metal center YbgI/SA1388 family protein